MSRKLVVFNDSSWRTPEKRSRQRSVPGNALLAAECLLPETCDGTRQIALVQSDQDNSSITRRVQRLLGTGIRSEIFTAYKFLAQNYLPGDEIFLFGASRGGYIMQRLAEMISISGLLTSGSLDQISKAYLYAQLANEARKGPSGQSLRANFDSRDTLITLLGVWDGVGNQGVPTTGLRALTRLWTENLRPELPENILSTYQALALDEHDVSLHPHIWTGTQGHHHAVVEQVWFAGRHQNITGGRRDCRLSDIPFRWMISKADKHGLAFDPEKVKDLSSPDPMGTLADGFLDQRLRRGEKQVRQPGIAETHFARKQMPGTERIHYTVKEKLSHDKDYKAHALAALPEDSLSLAYDEGLKEYLERKHHRLAINSPASLVLGQRRYNGNILDVSEGGARLWLQLDVPVGTPVILRSSALDQQDVQGEIVWKKDNSVGVSFEEDLVFTSQTSSSNRTIH